MASPSFGQSVALNGNLALVGARDDDPLHADAAYLFDATTGQQRAKLAPEDDMPHGDFGWSVALNENVALVGAPGVYGGGDESGSAYLFEAATGQPLFRLSPEDGTDGAEFGGSVAIGNNIALIGAARDDDNGRWSGSAYVFDVATGQQLLKLLPEDGHPGGRFGASVALSGNIALVGTAEREFTGVERYARGGSLYVFNTTTGQQLAKFSRPEDLDGVFVSALAIDGDTALIGAAERTGRGSAYLFDTTKGDQPFEFLPELELGAFSASLGGGGLALLADFVDAGRADSIHVFDVSTGQPLANLPLTEILNEREHVQSLAFNGAIALVGVGGDSNASGSAYVVYVPEPGTATLLLTVVWMLARERILPRHRVRPPSSRARVD